MSGPINYDYFAITLIYFVTNYVLNLFKPLNLIQIITWKHEILREYEYERTVE